MRRLRAAPVAVDFFTDPLCPRSRAMEPLVRSLHREEGLAFRSVQAGWLPSPAVKGVEDARAEWAKTAATGVRADPRYWDGVAPKTSLIAGAAVKAAELQGRARGEAYLSAVRSAAFERGADVTSLDVLAALAEATGLQADVFRVDLGVGRYAVEDVVGAAEAGPSLSEAVWWFGRRRMLRSWVALAADLRAAERHGLTSPAFRASHGTKEAVVRGLATEERVRSAIASVR